MVSATHHYFNNVQALRVLAASGVLFVHLLPIFGQIAPFGHFGVDIFFVLSGFLMARVIKTDSSKFIIQRLIRIVPVYWLFTLLIFTIAIFSPNLLHSTTACWTHLIKSLLFIPYTKESGLIQPVLFLGWTLNYEMYFYGLLTLCLLFNRINPLLTTACFMLIPVVMQTWLVSQEVFARFYGNPIVIEFILGMTIYQMADKRRLHSHLWIKIMVFVVCIVGLMWSEWTLGLKYRTFTLGVPAAIIVFLAVDIESQGCRVVNRGVLLMGGASYVLFLTHPFIFQFGEKIFAFGQRIESTAVLISEIGLVFVALAIAAAIHVWIENPIRRYLQKLCL